MTYPFAPQQTKPTNAQFAFSCIFACLFATSCSHHGLWPSCGLGTSPDWAICDELLNRDASLGSGMGYGTGVDADGPGV